MMNKALLAATVATGLIVPSAAAGLYVPPKPAIVKPENIEFSKNLLLGMPMTMGMLPKSGVSPSPVIAGVGTPYATATSSKPHDIPLPSGIQANDLLVMYTADSVGSTITAPAGWSAYTHVSGTGGSLFLRMYCFVKTATGSEGSTATITLSSSRPVNVQSLRITGQKVGLTTTELATASLGVGSTEAINPPSVTPSWGALNNLFIVAAVRGKRNLTVSTWPTGYTYDQRVITSSNSNSTNATLAICAKQAAVSPEDPSDLTFSSSGSGGASFVLAVRPA